MDFFNELNDDFSGIIGLPNKIIDSGSNLINNVVNLPNKILDTLTAMNVPIMIIGGIILLKELK